MLKTYLRFVELRICFFSFFFGIFNSGLITSYSPLTRVGVSCLLFMDGLIVCRLPSTLPHKRSLLNCRQIEFRSSGERTAIPNRLIRFESDKWRRKCSSPFLTSCWLYKIADPSMAAIAPYPKPEQKFKQTNCRGHTYFYYPPNMFINVLLQTTETRMYRKTQETLINDWQFWEKLEPW